ncbi:MAG: hypothetical protein RJP95_02470 [Pirellulales bacterium]
MKWPSEKWAEDARQRAMNRGFYTEDDSICFHAPNFAADGKIPLSSILIIAEETTSDGPWSDEIFLLIVDRDESGFLRFPMECAGTPELIKWLDSRLGPGLSWKLYNTAEPANNIVWPHNLKGRPLMVEAKATPVGCKQRLLAFFGLWKDQYSWEYTDAVKHYLREMGKVDEEI